MLGKFQFGPILSRLFAITINDTDAQIILSGSNAIKNRATPALLSIHTQTSNNQDHLYCKSVVYKYQSYRTKVEHVKGSKTQGLGFNSICCTINPRRLWLIVFYFGNITFKIDDYFDGDN